MSDTTTILLADLIQLATQHLDDLNYAEGTKQHYTRKWNRLYQYALGRKINTFSLELGYDFLKSHYGIEKGTKLKPSETHSVRVVKVLYEFMKHNNFQKCHQPSGKHVPCQFVSVFEEYIQLQYEAGLSNRTIKGKSIQLINFLSMIKVSTIEELRAKQVLEYVNLLDTNSQASKSGILFTLRDFLKFLYSAGYTIDPINTIFPVIFSNKFERIPSYYSTEEIQKILNCIDRNTEFGRRDYLIILLAVQLGMRAGDIRQLKLSNIKWNKDTIEFIQEKTKNPLQLPLLDNIKYALIDYMKNSRAKSESNFIFLRLRAPFIPFVTGNVFFGVIMKYMKAANIIIEKRKHGLHSMRHSMASNLLKQNIPFPVIAGVLGHETTNTTKLYLRIDIEQLRSVALEVSFEG